MIKQGSEQQMEEQKAVMVCDTSLFSAVILCFFLSFFSNLMRKSKPEPVLTQAEKFTVACRQITKDKPRIVCLRLPLCVCVYVCGSVNKVANSETDKNGSFTCQ